MGRDIAIAEAIKKKDLASITQIMFDRNSLGPIDGFKTETDLWDYKANCPAPGIGQSAAWAEIAKDVLAFFNNKGGLLIFGIHDKSFQFCGATHVLDSKLFNDQIRKFIGDRIWVEYHRSFIQKDQKYLGIAVIPQRTLSFERFVSESPRVNGKLLFSIGDSAIREGDSSKLVPATGVADLARGLGGIPTSQKYSVDEPYFRIISPDYHEFIERKTACAKVRTALEDPRSAIASINGIGGIGKTALSTWAVLEAYKRKQFHFIVSITAKDRELSPTGIQGMDPALAGFDSLLNDISEVLQCEYVKDLPTEEREKQVRSLIHDGKGLLYLDNLETIEDPRIIEFLNTLPVGVKAILTTRRGGGVRVSVHPIEPGPMIDQEAIAYVHSLSRLPALRYSENLSKPEIARITESCHYSPLAIRWVLARSKNSVEALTNAEGLAKSRKAGEELLEFCFRRIYDQMPGDEKSVLQTLSLFESPLSLESIMAGTEMPKPRVLDSLERFEEDGLVHKFYDVERNGHCYRIVPLGRAFVYSEVRKAPELEKKTRGRLVEWFEALDVNNPGERSVVRALRNGKTAEVGRILDLAIASERKGDLETAKNLYERAIAIAPESWRAYRLFGEFCRHKEQNQSMALRMYEMAVKYAPKYGNDRALIYRERGLLLERSGESNSFEDAIDSFEAALKETPNDPITIHALAKLYCLRGAHRKAIPLLEPLLEHANPKTRAYAKALLLDAYKSTNEMLKSAELRNRPD